MKFHYVVHCNWVGQNLLECVADRQVVVFVSHFIDIHGFLLHLDDTSLKYVVLDFVERFAEVLELSDFLDRQFTCFGETFV